MGEGIGESEMDELVPKWGIYEVGQFAVGPVCHRLYLGDRSLR